VLLRHSLNQAVHYLLKPQRKALSAEQGLYSLIIVEIKDLTYNAQFNFCLLHPELSRGVFDRSELAHFASLWLSPALAKSCDKLQNQTFKDRRSHKLPGNKKLNLGADSGLASDDACSLSGQD